jgi:transposase
MKQSSVQEIAEKFELHPVPISSWKREFLDNAALAFGPNLEKEDANPETGPLYNKIDQLQVENYFLKKS